MRSHVMMEIKFGVGVFMTFICVVFTKQVTEMTCTELEFFDEEFETCSLCSTCPMDTIVLQPCNSNQDTVCGPWTDFDGYMSVLEESSQSEEEPTVVAPEIVGPSQPVELLTDEWYRLSMALLGVLCFMSLCIAVYIVVACFICKKKREDKEILYQPEFMGDRSSTPEEPRYVECYMSSRDRLKRHPTTLTRLYANDVSGLSPIAPLLLPNTHIYVNTMDVIPENGLLQEVDSDGYVCIDHKF